MTGKMILKVTMNDHPYDRCYFTGKNGRRECLKPQVCSISTLSTVYGYCSKHGQEVIALETLVYFREADEK